MIYTARAGNNNEFFRDILRLYVREGSAVADLTWGRGKFWDGIDRNKYKLVRLDRHTPCDIKADFRAVPLADESQNEVVFDPPYVTTDGFQAPLQRESQRQQPKVRIRVGRRRTEERAEKLTRCMPPAQPRLAES